jgi:uncharacterized protein YceK
MKKLIILLAVLVISGCEVSANISSNGKANKSEILYYTTTVYVWIDPETKCEYFYDRILTPRLDRNGKQICSD